MEFYCHSSRARKEPGLLDHFFLTHSSWRTNQQEKEKLFSHGSSLSHHLLAVVAELEVEGDLSVWLAQVTWVEQKHEVKF